MYKVTYCFAYFYLIHCNNEYAVIVTNQIDFLIYIIYVELNFTNHFTSAFFRYN